MREWSGKIKDIRGYCSDCFDDFCATVQEVAGQRTLPQLLGILVIAVAFAIGMVALWSLLSFPIAFVVWLLWNGVMPDLGVPEIGYWGAYCLTLLCAILFRGNSVHLKE